MFYRQFPDVVSNLSKVTYKGICQSYLQDSKNDYYSATGDLKRIAVRGLLRPPQAGVRCLPPLEGARELYLLSGKARVIFCTSGKTGYNKILEIPCK